MVDIVRTSQVFVPGKLPAHTYNPRSEFRLEQQLNDYVEEAGAILTLAGPTKTGKSVLLRRIVVDPIWADGQGITDADELWRRLGDDLGVYNLFETTSGGGQTATARVGVEGTIIPGFLKATGGGDYAANTTESSKFGVTRPISSVVKEAIVASGRPVVVDDFHFVPRGAQREIVRALKPLVLEGVPIIFASVSHRVQDVVSAEPDMTGRVLALDVDFWTPDELLVIAQKGFAVLHVSDPGDALATELAAMSFGSPHLMQKFCRELCKANGVRETVTVQQELQAPPSWDEFFLAQTEAASADWFQRLLRGPQERGSARTQWQLEDGRTLDGYGLTLAAIASTGPQLAISKDEIKAKVDSLTAGNSPAPHQTTRVLQHMTKIAAQRASDDAPTEEQLEAPSEPDSVPDVQPVLEYIEDGPSSILHIADPFFAFYLRWGSAQHLAS